METVHNPHDKLFQESGVKYLEMFLRYICSVAENITPGELLAIAY